MDFVCESQARSKVARKRRTCHTRRVAPRHTLTVMRLPSALICYEKHAGDGPEVSGSCAGPLQAGRGSKHAQTVYRVHAPRSTAMYARPATYMPKSARARMSEARAKWQRPPAGETEPVTQRPRAHVCRARQRHTPGLGIPEHSRRSACWSNRSYGSFCGEPLYTLTLVWALAKVPVPEKRIFRMFQPVSCRRRAGKRKNRMTLTGKKQVAPSSTRASHAQIIQADISNRYAPSSSLYPSAHL